MTLRKPVCLRLDEKVSGNNNVESGVIDPDKNELIPRWVLGWMFSQGGEIQEDREILTMG